MITTPASFSAYVENYGDAVLMGGRYDTLLKQFDAPMPAIGCRKRRMRWLLLCSTTAGLKACPRWTLVHAESGEIKAQMKIRELTATAKSAKALCLDTADEAERYAKHRGILEVIVLRGEENA